MSCFSLGAPKGLGSVGSLKEKARAWRERAAAAARFLARGAAAFAGVKAAPGDAHRRDVARASPARPREGCIWCVCVR